MHVQSINNVSFGAKIKIDRRVKENLVYGGALSSAGTSLSGSGILSCLPASDPVHHIHSAGKVVDFASALGGSASGIGGSVLSKVGVEFIKEAIKEAKIPS